MTTGEKLYLTTYYGFDYDIDKIKNHKGFIALTEFFKDKANTDICLKTLHEAFYNRNMPELVENILVDMEMYEVLHEYHKPLSEEGEEFKKIIKPVI